MAKITPGNRPNIIRHWKALPPGASGTLDLASWLAYNCATSGTTAQTSSSTLNVDFPADAPRAFSRDGQNWALLVEPATTNLQPTDNFLEWDNAEGADILTCTLPDGSTANREVVDSSPSGSYIYDNNALGVAPAIHTISAWTWHVAVSGGSSAHVKVREQGSMDFAIISMTALDNEWNYRSATWDGVAGVGAAEAHVQPAAVGAVNTGTLRAAFVQVEESLYPTSYISGSRAAGIVSLPDPDTLFPGGYYDVEMTITPTFASDEHGTSVLTLLFFDSGLGANDDVRISGANQLEIWIDGNRVLTSDTLTWSRDQRMTLRFRHGPDGTYYKISGASSGNGTGTGGAQAATSLPSTAYLFGTSSGAQFGYGLAEIKFRDAR